MAMNHKEAFRRFYIETRDAAGLSTEHMVALVLMSAEENAAETEGVTEDSDEYWRVAHDSICCCDYFNSQPVVREWFASRGYEW